MESRVSKIITNTLFSGSRGKVISLKSKTGDGGSMLATQLQYSLSNEKIGVVNMKLSSKDIIHRLLAHGAKMQGCEEITLSSIKSPSEEVMVKKIFDDIRGQDSLYWSKTIKTPNDLKKAIKNMAKDPDLGKKRTLIIVDDLQQVVATGDEAEKEYLKDIGQWARDFSRKESVDVVLLTDRDESLGDLDGQIEVNRSGEFHDISVISKDISKTIRTTFYPNSATFE